MAKERTSVRMQAQIQRMAEQGYSVRAIARALKVSRKTVRKILGIAPKEESEVAGWIQTVDWDYVREEVYGKGTTIKQIHREVAPRYTATLQRVLQRWIAAPLLLYLQRCFIYFRRNWRHFEIVQGVRIVYYGYPAATCVGFQINAGTRNNRPVDILDLVVLFLLFYLNKIRRIHYP